LCATREYLEGWNLISRHANLRFERYIKEYVPRSWIFLKLAGEQVVEVLADEDGAETALKGRQLAGRGMTGTSLEEMIRTQGDLARS
jgi:hypothetical protein